MKTNLYLLYLTIIALMITLTTQLYADDLDCGSATNGATASEIQNDKAYCLKIDFDYEIQPEDEIQLLTELTNDGVVQKTEYYKSATIDAPEFTVYYYVDVAKKVLWQKTDSMLYVSEVVQNISEEESSSYPLTQTINFSKGIVQYKNIDASFTINNGRITSELQSESGPIEIIEYSMPFELKIIDENRNTFQYEGAFSGIETLSSDLYNVDGDKVAHIKINEDDKIALFKYVDNELEALK